MGGATGRAGVYQHLLSLKQASPSVQSKAQTMSTGVSVEGGVSVVEGSTETQSNPVADALARLEGVIDQKISTLKRDLSAENEKKLTRMAKRFKTDKKHELKHEGNRQQFNHQSDVEETLQSAFDALSMSKRKKP